LAHHRVALSADPPVRTGDDKSGGLDALIELESATNPRLRDEIGEISLVPPERRHQRTERVLGDGVIHPYQSARSRFSDGTWGVYYAANRIETAIAETVHHFAQYAGDANDPPRREDMRVLVGTITNTFHDVDTLPRGKRAAVLDPDSYDAAARSRARCARLAAMV